MFHHWRSTDDEHTDVCMGCGVASHVTTEEAVSDHGPLPVMCPGPQVGFAHHFTLIGPVGPAAAFLDCERGCGATITDDTEPVDVNWECIQI